MWYILSQWITPFIIAFHLSLEDDLDFFVRNFALILVLVEFIEMCEDECTTFFHADAISIKIQLLQFGNDRVWSEYGVAVVAILGL